jgi:RES domain-containing protein
VLHIARLELSLELSLASGALLLFRVIRPSLDVGCGSALSQMSDDFIEFFATHSLAIVVPAAVALVELNYAIRPWVKRAVRLGIGTAAILAIGSYAVLAAAFIR